MTSGGSAMRRTGRRRLIDRELLCDLLRTILAHDALLDDVDLLCEHAAGDPSVVAASLAPLVADTLAAATTQDWQRVATRLIADTHDADEQRPQTTRKR